MVGFTDKVWESRNPWYRQYIGIIEEVTRLNAPRQAAFQEEITRCANAINIMSACKDLSAPEIIESVMKNDENKAKLAGAASSDIIEAAQEMCRLVYTRLRRLSVAYEILTQKGIWPKSEWKVPSVDYHMPDSEVMIVSKLRHELELPPAKNSKPLLIKVTDDMVDNQLIGQKIPSSPVRSMFSHLEHLPQTIPTLEFLKLARGLVYACKAVEPIGR